MIDGDPREAAAERIRVICYQNWRRMQAPTWPNIDLGLEVLDATEAYWRARIAAEVRAYGDEMRRRNAGPYGTAFGNVVECTAIRIEHPER